MRNGVHHLITSGTTWYFPNPSEVAVAPDFHGPWTVLGDPHPLDASRTSFRSQISCVFEHPEVPDLYVAMADRWLPEVPADQVERRRRLCPPVRRRAAREHRGSRSPADERPGHIARRLRLASVALRGRHGRDRLVRRVARRGSPPCAWLRTPRSYAVPLARRTQCHLRREAGCPVETDHLAVEIRVGDDRFGEQRVLLGAAESLRERDVVRPAPLGRRATRSRGVSIEPGAMAHTRTPMGARSRAIGRIIETIAPLAAAYGTMLTWPSKALIDAVCTMTPRSPSSFGLVRGERSRRQSGEVERAAARGARGWPATSPWASANRPGPPGARLGMTTPVALTAIENTPSDSRGRDGVGHGIVVVAVAGDRGDQATELRDQFTRPLHVWIEDHRCCTSGNETADGRARRVHPRPLR